MAYGDYHGPDKPDKGKQDGSCNQTSCQSSPANWYNHGLNLWYCSDCRFDIEFNTLNLHNWETRHLPYVGHPRFETQKMMDKRQNKTMADAKPSEEYKFYRFKCGTFIEADNFTEAKEKFIKQIQSESENSKGWHKCTCLGLDHRHGCPARSKEIPF